ncbi:hypothetical protein [Actinokineospora iranica]|uniref:p-aminobenzoate N-oxygenase AurF n=1 Tax=Actinokineospora iranica TaxID=1271860 RepID=A0A1G6XNV9_9PSEU|nr:hypothetical protein [Actinokineospora iranica]SDD78966.1 hypothetical protein SAMN05216174_11814 [Actinokineospora iranica]
MGDGSTDDRDVLSHSALRHYVRDVCPRDYLDQLLDVVREHTDDDLPFYTDAVTAAFSDAVPVFARPRYVEFFWRCATTVPGYAARAVLANGPAESEGSEKLFRLWRSVHHDTAAADQILHHARDEAAHSRLFVRLTETAFPGFLSPESGDRLEWSLPDVRARPLVKTENPIPQEHLIDHLVQMNIGEIRTRLHMHLFAPVVFGLTPKRNKATTRRILEGLVRDEVRHIGYTAALMEGWARDGAAERIRRLYSGRLAIFNRITVEQTEAAVRDHGRGEFPDLIEL